MFVLSIYLLSIYGPCSPRQLFQFLNLYTVGRTPWTGDQPVARPPPTHRTTQTLNKRTQASMPRVRYELTISVFERAKTVHASDGAATVTGLYRYFYISLSFLLLPLWSIGHQWNALFHFSFLILRRSVGRTHWTGDQPIARPLSIQTHNKHKHPCLGGGDSNPRSQRSSERRRFML
jgi:hypothetical protein